MLYPQTEYPFKYKHTAGLLGIFGGTLGLHNFYLGNRQRGMTQLLITVIGSLFFGIGPVVSYIWGLIEGIQILTGSITSDGQGNPIINPDYAAVKSRSKIIAGFLGICLGVFGVHNFYLGNTGKAVAQLLLGTVGSCIVVGPLISQIWGIVDGVQILSGTVTVDGEGKTIYDPAGNGTPGKSRAAAGLLAVLFGTFGVHNFYLGNTNRAVAQLLLGTLGSFLIVGPIISYIWGLTEGISILSEAAPMDASGRILIAD